MCDNDAHVYMSRIISKALNLTEDSERSPSPAFPEFPLLPPLPLSAAHIPWINASPTLQTTYLSIQLIGMIAGTLSQAMPCACQRSRELPNKISQPYISSDPSEDYDETHEMREDNPTQQLRHVHKDDEDDEDDTSINPIKVLTDRSFLSRCVLDSGANRHILKNETWL